MLGRRFDRLTALVVDENEESLASIRGAFVTLGFGQVLPAEDAFVADMIVDHTPVHLILMEQWLSPFDGIELTRRIRARDDRQLATVPIILHAMVVNGDIVQGARDAGITDFVAKPASMATLQQRIIASLTKPRPFISSHIYTGPCRRRRALRRAGMERRRLLPQPHAALPRAPAHVVSTSS